MNYTKTIREFCTKNKDTLFDVSYMAAAYFSMVPYKTLLKILNRLADEGILIPVSKGLFYIQGDKPFDLDSAIKEYYVDNDCGMFVGYKMYNDLQISDHSDSTVEIYTNKIGAAHKSIGKYHLTYADLYFDHHAKSIIQTLELIEHGSRIIDIDYLQYNSIRQSGYRRYLDFDINRVITGIHYQYSTLVTFHMQLKEAGFSNDFLQTYTGA